MSVEESNAPKAGAGKYDLTRTISKYLDLHMMFPLLDFVEMATIYPADQVAQARLDLLDATNMVSGYLAYFSRRRSFFELISFAPQSVFDENSWSKKELATDGTCTRRERDKWKKFQLRTYAILPVRLLPLSACWVSYLWQLSAFSIAFQSTRCRFP